MITYDLNYFTDNNIIQVPVTSIDQMDLDNTSENELEEPSINFDCIYDLLDSIKNSDSDITESEIKSIYDLFINRSNDTISILSFDIHVNDKNINGIINYRESTIHKQIRF